MEWEASPVTVYSVLLLATLILSFSIIVRNGLLACYTEEHGLELGSSCLIGMGKPETLLEQGIYYLAAEKL